jgi:uncharacterized protein YyaL (SSP411 family)
MSEKSHKFTNQLINETSPYLLQHAHNPVDWRPWGPEALERSRREDKPILLSVGYSACHWCHVMERESFENEAIAGLMNEHFINIKVDREERPDLDAIYMNAVQMMTGHGGWPMTVFLTPDGRPFYGGTYFPPADRQGMPGFPRVLIAVAEGYRERRDEIEQSAEGLLNELRRQDSVLAPSQQELTVEIMDHAAADLLHRHDPVHGGFGRAPKFPPSMTLTFLLRQHQRSKDPAIRTALELSLRKMAKGGMYDQLGGGFHRYSVDEKWLAPHFEKMLYDNALLARLYLDAYLALGDPFYKQICIEILDYVRREMTDSSGGFYSAQDADSEGEEGKFFLWSPQEVDSLLGAEDGRLFRRYFDVTETGNFEDSNILHVDEERAVIAKLMGVAPERLDQVLERGKRLLFEARESRIKPHRDEKTLTAWNALMLRSFAEAGRALDRPDYLEIAVRNAEFLLTSMRPEGAGDRLLRTYKDGRSKLNAYLEDYAYLSDALLALYEATFDEKWFVHARSMADAMIRQFWDHEEGGFYFTSEDHETLITRTKDFYDNAIPAGNSVAVGVLLRLGLLTGEARYRELAERVLKSMKPMMMRAPTAFGHLLSALDFYMASPYEIALVGRRDAADAVALTRIVFSRYLPNRVVAFGEPGIAGSVRLLEDRPMINDKATAYVCRNFYCEAPTTDAGQLAAQLES